MVLLKSDYEILIDFQRESSNMSPDWITYKDTPEEKIKYRFEGGNSICSLYLEKVIHAPMINLMAVLAEA